MFSSPGFCLRRPLTALSADGEQQLCQVAVVLALPSLDCQLVLAGTGAFRPGPPDEVLDKLRPSISVCDHLQRAIRPNCVPEYIERMTREK